MTMQPRFTLTAPRLTLMIALAAILAAQPWSVRFDPASGSFALSSGAALADSDGEDHDDDRDDDSDDDRDDDRDGDHGDDDGRDDDHDDHGSDDGNDDNGTDDDDSRDDNGRDDDEIVIIPGGEGSPSAVSRIEISSDGIEVTYSDGSREEVESGVYERKDTTGRTVEERPATQADLDRLNALR